MSRQTYTPLQTAHSQTLDIRGLKYRIHSWGDPSKPAVYLLHGWADTGLSFQFLADELARDYFLIAPDWRGFGESGWSQQGYWFPDYLADLECIIEHFSGSSEVSIVGHSMGGNVACLYAGIRPQRVSYLASLDVFGLPDSDAGLAPERYAQWLDQVQVSQSFSEYENMDTLVQHIVKLAPGLKPDRAEFIAVTWAKPSASGHGFTVKADPSHKRVNPVLYRRGEAQACWRQINAKTLFLHGEDSRFYKSYREDGYQQECRSCIQNLSEDSLANASHMLHLQQPAALAKRLKLFFSS